MSTLKVATIQDTSGNNSSTPNEVAQGRAKAWVNFDGSGTVAVRDDFNVSSITDNGTGDYTVTFATAMANVNYAVAGTVAEVGSTGNSDYFLSGGRQNNYSDIRTTTFARIAACAASGAQIDGHVMSVVIFGD